MIIVSFKGKKSPLIGNVKGFTLFQDTRRTSVARAIFRAMNSFEGEKEGFLFVAPGGRVNSARVYPVMQDTSWDVAAFVDRIGAKPAVAGPFNGIGWVSLDSVLFRRTPASSRVLNRWMERNDVSPGREALNLAITLNEMKDAKFLHLSRTWIWRESSMRTQDLSAQPVVEFPSKGITLDEAYRISKLSSSAVKAEMPQAPPPGVLWVGHLYQYTGYGKANREILFRLANSMSVRIDDTHKEPVYVKEDLRSRLDVHKNILVDPRAPLLRMMGPDHISQKTRHRIVWTMQESSIRVHDDMVKRANANFDEIWTPSQWNLDVFKHSGIKLPGRVMPLGIDPIIFRPQKRTPLPTCRLISTRRRGLMAVPDGFVFLTIGLPGFRKGWDVVADAMEHAFSRNKHVHFVIGLTHSPPAWNEKVYKQFAKYKVPIWTLEGSFDEHGISRIYAAVDAYVSASRGEGFNLPAAEAAACGIPVIVPNNTCHTEIFTETFMFKPDGVRKYPEGDWISDWYKGQLFSSYEKPSIRKLSELLRTVYRGGREVTRRREALRLNISKKYTWDAAASRVARRLMEVQP